MGAQKLTGVGGVRIGKEIKTSIIDITREKVDVTPIELPEKKWYNNHYALVLNPVTHKWIFANIGAENPKRGNEFSTSVNMIDPIAKTVEPINNIGFSEKTHQYYNETFSEKKGYTGILQDVVANDDGSFLLIFEDLTIAPNSGMGTTSSLGVNGIMVFDKDAHLTAEYLVPKLHWISKKALFPMYKHNRDLGAVELFESNQYKSFAYFSTGTRNFILFNDTEKNNKIKKSKVSLHCATSLTKTVCVLSLT